MAWNTARPVELATALETVRLRELVADDAGEYHALVRASRTHLTAHGDYGEEVAASLDDVLGGFSQAPALPTRFGVLDEGRLVGRVDLVPVDPPRFGLGYWLAPHATGKGYATVSVAALLDHAAGALGATDVFAGVTHGNASSEAVLRRLGFEQVAAFDTYVRWHRSLVP